METSVCRINFVYDIIMLIGVINLITRNRREWESRRNVDGDVGVSFSTWGLSVSSKEASLDCPENHREKRSLRQAEK